MVCAGKTQFLICVGTPGAVSVSAITRLQAIIILELWVSPAIAWVIIYIIVAGVCAELARWAAH